MKNYLFFIDLKIEWYSISSLEDLKRRNLFIYRSKAILYIGSCTVKEIVFFVQKFHKNVEEEKKSIKNENLSTGQLIVNTHTHRQKSYTVYRVFKVKT